MRIESVQKHSYIYDESRCIYKSENSTVYEAIDEMMNRKVCLKVVDYSGFAPGSEKALTREVTALSRSGEATVRVPMLLDYWTDKNKKLFYVVMQLIPGNTLRAEMNPDKKKTFIYRMISLCDILGAVHRNHIYHKDVKPENIIITPGGDVYLIDFNISIGVPNLKSGTVTYRAPEMYKKEITVSRDQVDMFSIGVIMYEFFAGEAPRIGVDYGTDDSDMTGNWSYFKNPCEKSTEISLKLGQIIEKCMKLRPADRYRNMWDLKKDLKDILREFR